MFTDLPFRDETLRVVDLPALAGDKLTQLPHIHRILLENVARTAGADAPAAIAAILGALETGRSDAEIPFLPRRVMMHDTTCGPALADIAGMRSALAEAGHDPALLKPVLPVDVSTDHSIGVDAFASPDALKRNMQREMERNGERFRFMKWAAQTLDNVRIHPPGTGIMHTLNLERLATVVSREQRDGVTWAAPDTLIGTDSHTPMVNGIGVLAWGVGGLEAESVLFGMPVMAKVPEVVGVRLTGTLRAGVMASDLVLYVTEQLRRIDLQDRYVEFFGPGVSSLSAGDRAVVANMTPEFGANTGFFPVDGATLRYLRDTGRDDEAVALVETYCRSLGLWFEPDQTPRFAEVVDIDLGAVETSLAGPRRPQDRLRPSAVSAALKPLLKGEGQPEDGAVAIAAITSCTNTSDPRLLVAAGLLARKARHLGLRPASWVKTSMAPGSPTARTYLERAGVLSDLEALGFGIVGYGCTTCNGNSGGLTEAMEEAVSRGATPVAVLSGNRNFPGRVHGRLAAAFLTSPALTIAYALAGDVNRDIAIEPLNLTGKPVYLRDIWPTSAEIDEALAGALAPQEYAAAYEAAESNSAWRQLEAPSTLVYPWDETSTYIRRPPFANFGGSRPADVFEAHPILVLGDDITTDHISPAGQIPARSEAARYLIARGEPAYDLNVFASRRANWEVMLRGLFANPAVENLLDTEIPPGFTIHAPTGELMPLWQAADLYERAAEPVVLVAGERYGMGSSRDWAAKGLGLLGVRAVLANSFERIHRSNLIGMGIIPLRLPEGVSPATLALKPGDRLRITAPLDRLSPRGEVPVIVVRQDGSHASFVTTAAVETALELELLQSGGALPSILARAVAS